MPGVSLVNDGAALQSMRDSDFDAYSAIGEVIDNALQAECQENVRIRIDFNTPRVKKALNPSPQSISETTAWGCPRTFAQVSPAGLLQPL